MKEKNILLNLNPDEMRELNKEVVQEWLGEMYWDLSRELPSRA